MREQAPMRNGGFTLVELLTTMLVLVILLLAVVGILNSANNATGDSRRRIVADSEARAVFDRIADDLGHMADRADVDFALGRNSGTGTNNDALFFYCEGSALANTSYSTAQQTTTALVGYRINPNFQMERLGKSMAVGAAAPNGMMFLTYPAPTLPLVSPAPTPMPASTFSDSSWAPLIGTSPNYTDSTNTTYYHVLGESVFRLEFCYLLKPATQPDGSTLKAIYSNFPTRGGTTNTVYGSGLQQVQALVVAVAILDPDSRKILNAASLPTLTNSLVDPTNADLTASPPKLMAQTWNAALVPNNYTGAMKTAASRVRVYQRTFYLHPFLH